MIYGHSTGLWGVIVWATGSSPRGTAQSVGGVTLRLRLIIIIIVAGGDAARILVAKLPVVVCLAPVGRIHCCQDSAPTPGTR